MIYYMLPRVKFAARPLKRSSSDVLLKCASAR